MIQLKVIVVSKVFSFYLGAYMAFVTIESDYFSNIQKNNKQNFLLPLPMQVLTHVLTFITASGSAGLLPNPMFPGYGAPTIPKVEVISSKLMSMYVGSFIVLNMFSL